MHTNEDEMPVRMCQDVIFILVWRNKNPQTLPDLKVSSMTHIIGKDGNLFVFPRNYINIV